MNNISFREAIINYKNAHGKPKSIIIPDGESVRINSTDKGFLLRRPTDSNYTKIDDIEYLKIDKQTKVNFYIKDQGSKTLRVNEVSNAGLLDIYGKNSGKKQSETVIVEKMETGSTVRCFENPFVKIQNIIGGQVLASNNTTLQVDRNDGFIGAINSIGEKAEIKVSLNDRNGRIFASGFLNEPEGDISLHVEKHFGLMNLRGKCKSFIDKLLAGGRILAEGENVKINLEGVQEGINPSNYEIELKKGANLNNLSRVELSIKNSD